ncbi:hypothetical protein [Flavobacterium geliluteum]|uniref:Uncharacterized protein n=1 Tax=Flavobacterium geliluteum TaxID=2816120 RepID=A0A941AV48_9FLAO|nr:hypothetical protein [Flavobacterium geliluteum]MBP4136704.1 hypothetical protein [Flavobacterium geliluteum]
MLNDHFFEYASQKITEGQSFYASHIKLMVQSLNKELYELLDPTNDAIFLNPMLFAFLNDDTGKITLEQILYGAVPPEKRMQRVTVVSNSKGQIYLPLYGCITLPVLKEQHYTLITHNKDLRIEVFDGTTLIPHLFRTNPVLHESRVELQCVSNYFTEHYLPENYASQPSFCSKPKKVEELHQAVAILQQQYPRYYSLFCQTTKWLLPFTNSKSNSFASLGMHGVGFINTYKSTGVVGYLEDIVHQCGHVLFSALTYDTGAYFTIPPVTAIKDFTNDPNDDRTFYVLLHGVFTEALMCEAFDICLQNHVFDAQKEHELKGRYAYILLRFVLDIQILLNHNYFTPEGQTLFDAIYNHMVEQYKKHSSLLQTYDLTNQPYNFDLTKFNAKNKMPKTEHSSF